MSESIMYIIDPNKQRSLIAEMNQLRKNNQTWEVYYHHPLTNDMWKSFFPKGKNDDSKLKILRTEPVSDRLEERLENCLINAARQDAVGLGIELSVIPQKWEALMDIVESNYRRYDRKLLPLFLKKLGAERVDINSKEKSLSEEKAAELAGRSKKIRFKRCWFF